MAVNSLEVLSESDVNLLRDEYEHYAHPYVYSFLNTALKWRKSHPDKNYITIYGPIDWKDDGTFIALLQVCLNKII